MSQAGVDERTLTPLIDMKAVWNILWSRRVMVVAIAGAVLLLALLYLAVTKPSYTATASVLIDPRDPRATNFSNVLPGIGADSAAIASQVFVIKSRDLLDAVFKDQNLANDPEFSSTGLMSRLRALFGKGGTSAQDRAFKRFQSRLSVEREGLTYVIDVSFTSGSPERAARIANAIVDHYGASLAGQRDAANNDVNSALTAKIGTLQKSVDDAEYAVQNFKFEHKILDSGSGGTLQSQIDQVTTQLIAAQGDANRAKDRYDQALAAGDTPAGLAKLSGALSSTNISKLRDDYNRRAAALANLEAVYGPRHPAVKRLQSELGVTKRLMADEAARIRQYLKSEYDLARQNVATLQAKLNALRNQSKTSDIAQVQLRQLESKAQAARSVLDDFRKRAQETSHLDGLQISEARIISIAAPPDQPTWPKPFLLLPVSLLLGLAAGCGLALTLGPAHESETDPQNRPGKTAPKVEIEEAGGPAPPRAVPLLVNFGEYRLPGITGASTRSNLDLVSKRLFQTGYEPLSDNVLQLLERISQHLNGRPKPVVLLASSIHNNPQAEFAGRLIGIGLQRIGQKVLMVEIGTEAGRQALSRAAQHGIFTDDTSGLQTVAFDAAVETEKGNNANFGGVLAEAGRRFDFIILVGLSAAGADWDPHLFAEADLTLFALAPGEAATEAASLLRRHLKADQIGRSAMFTVLTGNARPGERRMKQSGSAPGAYGRQPSPVAGTSSLRLGKDSGY
ncbi:MAG TPA: GumC family protein [Rhizobiaceae bacterium]|nr:GumC family protein [Rhizobiaceae bacterium]